MACENRFWVPDAEFLIETVWGQTREFPFLRSAEVHATCFENHCRYKNKSQREQDKSNRDLKTWYHWLALSYYYGGLYNSELPFNWNLYKESKIVWLQQQKNDIILWASIGGKWKFFRKEFLKFAVLYLWLHLARSFGMTSGPFPNKLQASPLETSIPLSLYQWEVSQFQSLILLLQYCWY